jgi:hypothetical protein
VGVRSSAILISSKIVGYTYAIDDGAPRTRWRLTERGAVKAARKRLVKSGVLARRRRHSSARGTQGPSGSEEAHR